MMKKAILIAALALVLATLAAQGVSAPWRDGYFWRLESEGSYNSSSSPYTTDQENISYYYNTGNPSQLDSMKVVYSNNYYGSSLDWSYFTRTDNADGYVIEEARYHSYEGEPLSFAGATSKTYNWQDQLLLERNFSAGMQPTNHYEYAYDAQGNQVSAQYYIDNYPNASTLDWEELSTYNDAGLLTWYRTQKRHWQTEQMFTLREEEHFYSVHPAPDSSVVFIQSQSTGATIQSLLDRQYNSFDLDGNLIHKLQQIYPNPDGRSLRDPMQRNTYTQYIFGVTGWLPSQELSYGTFVNHGWSISCGQDSTLATYSYSGDFLQENYAWHSYISLQTSTRTTHYNDAGLMTTQSGESYSGDYSSSFNRHWDWAYVSTEADDPQTPPALATLSCAPNPFQESLGLKLSAEAGAFRISVYNVRGQLVRVLADGSKHSGEYYTSWDGKDGDGNKLPSGVYVLRAETASGTVLARVSLFR